MKKYKSTKLRLPTNLHIYIQDYAKANFLSVSAALSKHISQAYLDPNALFSHLKARIIEDAPHITADVEVTASLRDEQDKQLTHLSNAMMMTPNSVVVLILSTFVES